MSKKKNAEAEQDKEKQENVEAENEAPETVSKEEYDKLKEEFDTQKDQFLRMAAEYDNFRKRTEKEKLAAFDNALATTVEAFLPVADSFNLALTSTEGVSDEFMKGLDMISKQLENAFKKLNVEQFGERGEKFDPQLHDAVSKVDDDELEEDYIASVYQKGYKVGDKIIRHAMVVISN